MLYICNDCAIDWQIWENMWSGLGWVEHTKNHPSCKRQSRKTSVVVTLTWICNEVKIKGVQYIYNAWAIEWHQIYEAVWAEPSTKYQSDGRTDGRTHIHTWILYPPPFRGIRPAGDNGDLESGLIIVFSWLSLSSNITPPPGYLILAYLSTPQVQCSSWLYELFMNIHERSWTVHEKFIKYSHCWFMN